MKIQTMPKATEVKQKALREHAELGKSKIGFRKQTVSKKGRVQRRAKGYRERRKRQEAAGGTADSCQSWRHSWNGGWARLMQSECSQVRSPI